MAIATADILKLNVRALYGGSTSRNIYHYSVNEVVGTPEILDLAQDWWGQVNTILRAVSDQTLVYQDIVIESLTGDRDFAVYPIPSGSAAGTITQVGTKTPSFLATSLRLTLATRAIRSGWKRYAGVSWSYLGDYGALGAGYNTALNLLGALLEDTLTLEAASGSVVAIPVVVGRRNVPFPDTLITAPITGWSVSPYVTTQNTRKRNRGE